jgi:putative spermidine/putrescine transport system substrate-binding protein
LPTEGNQESLEKGEIPIQIKYDFNLLAAQAKMKEKGVNTQVIIPGVSIYAPSALMVNKYNVAKMDLAKMFLEWVLSDDAQLIFAEFGARPVRYVLGDLQLPDSAKAKWLPDSAYANVKTVKDWNLVSPAQVAAVWDERVLGG